MGAILSKFYKLDVYLNAYCAFGIGYVFLYCIPYGFIIKQKAIRSLQRTWWFKFLLRKFSLFTVLLICLGILEYRKYFLRSKSHHDESTKLLKDDDNLNDSRFNRS